MNVVVKKFHMGHDCRNSLGYTAEKSHSYSWQDCLSVGRTIWALSGDLVASRGVVCSVSRLQGKARIPTDNIDAHFPGHDFCSFFNRFIRSGDYVYSVWSVKKLEVLTPVSLFP